MPCCASDNALGSLRDSTLTEIWNSEGMRKLRLNMLQGTESPGCVQCYRLEQYIEGSKGTLRLGKNSELAAHFPLVGSTRADGTVEKLNLPYWDIKFSNSCNLRCRYCGPASSTSWYQEGLLFPELFPMFNRQPRPRLQTPTRDPKDLWRQLEGFLPQLEQIYFAGGEPLVTEECYQILKIRKSLAN